MVFVVGDVHKVPDESDEKPETGTIPEPKPIRSVARKFWIEKESGNVPMTVPEYGAVKVNFEWSVSNSLLAIYSLCEYSDLF